MGLICLTLESLFAYADSLSDYSSVGLFVKEAIHLSEDMSELQAVEFAGLPGATLKAEAAVLHGLNTLGHRRQLVEVPGKHHLRQV